MSARSLAFAEPGSPSIIDTITGGLGTFSRETLEQVRERYPRAEIVDFDDWLAAKAAAQDAPVTWTKETEEQYWHALEVLPPAVMFGGSFLVGEPADHHAGTGEARYECHRLNGEGYLVSSRPMTRREFRAMLADKSAEVAR